MLRYLLRSQTSLVQGHDEVPVEEPDLLGTGTCRLIVEVPVEEPDLLGTGTCRLIVEVPVEEPDLLGTGTCYLLGTGT